MNLSTANEVSNVESLQARIQYFLVKAAVAIATEEPEVAARRKLAAAILNNALNTRIVTLMVLSNATIAAMEDPTTATDSDLEFTVNSLIPALILTVSR